MKNNGIVSKKSNRRDALSFLLFVFLLPYVCACLWGHVGEETAKLRKTEGKGQQDVRMVEASLSWGIWELPVEEYLTYLLLLIMPEESEAEALKAQAVLLRTELAARYTEQSEKTIFLEAEELSRFYGGYEDAAELAACRRAVEATAGTILTYRSEPVRASSLQLTGEGEKSFCYVAAGGQEFAMNQKEAESLAQKGNNWQEILEHFFFESELAKFE
ncbi:MAG: hypothetical protein K2O59_13395 [Lachnospiraceae bacterium]|nr:hypothetical protein [Lachnospiraceae bacterium]